MDWSTHVHASQTADTNPSVVITFTSGKYLFNVGENTTRAFIQGGTPGGGGWKRMKSIFLTGLTPERSSGVPGMLMTLADATVQQVHVVGPPGLLHYLASMRLFTYRDSMPVAPIEAPLQNPESVEPSPLYKDDNIAVYPLQIHSSSQSLPYGTDIPADGLKRKRTPSPSDPADSPPRKRANTLESESAPTSLQEYQSSEAFKPSDLSAHPDVAQEWRKLMIDRIFPAKMPTPEPKSKKVKSGKGEKAKKAEAQGPSKPPPPPPTITTETELEPLEDYWRRPPPPQGYNSQLPHHFSTQRGLTQSYIVIGPHIRGKFDASRSKALGVPSGPLIGKLTRGEAVTFRVKSTRTNADGVEEAIEVERTVQPEDVMGASDPPGVVIVLDVPSPSHIDSLISAFKAPFYSQFRSQHASDAKKYAVRVIYHFLGDGVLEDPRYKEFMRGFSQQANHLISSDPHLPDPTVFHSVAYSTLQLNKLDPIMFPTPYYRSNETQPLSEVSGLPKLTRPMIANTFVNMRPLKPPVTFTPAECGDLFHPAMISGEVGIPSATQEEFTTAKVNLQVAEEERDNKSFPGSDVVVTSLGTGSALPSKFRNVSSTLIQVPNWGNVLLDAGEGTWGQLVRKFGISTSKKGEDDKEDVWTALRNLKCIFISHVHADHHLGLAQILAKRKQLNPPPTEPLFLVTIRPVHLYLRELSDLYDLGLDLEDESLSSGSFKKTAGVVPIMSDALHFRRTGVYMTVGKWRIGGDEPWTDFERSQVAVRQLCDALGLESFETVDVPHRTKCYGVVIKSKEGWSIVFSGDTQPSTALVAAGKDATLLIHEATMADGQEDMAKKKAHSTFGQALDIGRRMKAKHILLTHFSQRYPKLPPSVVMQPTRGSKSEDEPVVALAIDHAQFRIGDLWKFRYYLPAVEKHFMDTEEEGEGQDVVVLQELEEGLIEVDGDPES
ncbi:hypothetical protein BDN72DRAFT_758625 [Pluteus cervinus]|uniref:Uncharacterized protein n=1 Tax=Pluteus cervinus TaxID=181527 RepID=A0ACD3BB47_9AGAR|nr:hypothetical protein BDN72DRAFT_758625 [Pluteus cervinus]